MPPKKAAPGVTVLLIDCGKNMEEVGNFEKAIDAADWIISRKLFSQDSETFVVMGYNLDPTENPEGVRIHEEEFQPANFDHLRFIRKELALNSNLNQKNNAFYRGVLSAINLLKTETCGKNGKNPSGVTLIVLTNGMNEHLRQESVDLLEDAIREAEQIELMVIGISENPVYPASKIVELVESFEGRIYNFENVSQMLSNYQARQKSERKFNKMWDIAPGIRLPVIFTLKSEKSTAFLKFKNADVDGNEMVRLEQLHVEQSQSQVKIEAKIDEFVEKTGKNEEFDPKNEKKLEKMLKPAENSKVLHGYNFGKSVIMMDPEYLKETFNDHNFNEGQTGGVLKLIQFTKRANILDSYLIDASAKTVLPSLNFSKNLTNATVSLISAMLELRVAAICRYTFHAKSHVALVALLPHRDPETGVLYLRSVKLPFSDDMRSLKFPKAALEDQEPTVAQLSAVDDLIDSMQLGEREISSLVEGGLTDPQLQMQCHFLKSFVLNPEDSLDSHTCKKSEIVDKMMAPKRKIESSNPSIFSKLSAQFNLEKVEKSTRRRLQVAPEDVQSLIDEWTTRKATSEDVTAKEAKKKRKMTMREEIEADLDGGETAGVVCGKMLKMIGNTCGFQQNSAVRGFFELLLNDLKTLRSVLISRKICTEFNEMLKKVKEEEDFEPFAEFLAEEKECNPIDNSEVDISEFSNSAAVEFWEEN